MASFFSRAADKVKDTVSAGMSRQVAKVLNRTLGHYIEGGIDAQKFEFDVFSGEVSLRNLQVSEGAFRALGLPVHLVASYVGEIDLKIPFANLKTEPIVVSIRRVYISLRPDDDCDKRTIEQLQLAALETKWNDLKPAASAVDDEDNLLGSYVQKIMDNIQVTIEAVHIRYEDGLTAQRASWVSDADSSFAAGVTLDRVEIKSFQVAKNGAWVERFVAEGQRFLNKRLKVGETLQATGAEADAGAAAANLQQSGVAVYCNLAEQPYGNPGSKAWRQIMDTAIARNGRVTKTHSYVLSPLACVMHVSVDTKPQTAHKTQYSSRVRHGDRGATNELAVRLGRLQAQFRGDQIKVGLNAFSWIENVWNYQDATALRPKVPLPGNPRLWWKFAIAIHTLRHKERIRRLSYKSMQKSFAVAKQYIELYQRHCADGRPWLMKVSQAELSKMRRIEADAGFHLASSWRQIAWHQMMRRDNVERLIYEKSGRKTPVKMSPEQLKMFGGSQRLIDNHHQSASVQLTNQQLLALLVDMQSVQMAFNMQEVVLLKACVDRLQLSASVDSDGAAEIHFHVLDMRIADGYTVNAAFPTIMQRTDRSSDLPVVRFRLQKQAFDSRAVSIHLELQTQPVTVVVPYSLLAVLMRFVTEIQQGIGNLDEVKIRARRKIDELKDEYLLMVGREMRERSTQGDGVPLSADIRLGGVCFLLPQSCERRQSNHVLQVDTGALVLQGGDATRDAEFDRLRIETTGFSCDLLQSEHEADTILQAANLQGLVQVHRLMDPTVAKMRVDLEISSTAIKLSDNTIYALGSIFAAFVAALPKSQTRASGTKQGTVATNINKLMIPTTLQESPVANEPATETGDSPALMRQLSCATEVPLAFKEWTLLCVNLQCPALCVVIQRSEETLMEQHLVGVVVQLQQRPFDRMIKLRAEKCELRDYGVAPSAVALGLSDVEATVMQADAESPTANGTTSTEQYTISSTATIAIRPGLVKAFLELAAQLEASIESLTSRERATVSSAKSNLAHLEQVYLSQQQLVRSEKSPEAQIQSELAAERVECAQMLLAAAQRALVEAELSAGSRVRKAHDVSTSASNRQVSVNLSRASRVSILTETGTAVAVLGAQQCVVGMTSSTDEESFSLELRGIACTSGETAAQHPAAAEQQNIARIEELQGQLVLRHTESDDFIDISLCSSSGSAFVSTEFVRQMLHWSVANPLSVYLSEQNPLLVDLAVQQAACKLEELTEISMERRISLDVVIKDTAVVFPSAYVGAVDNCSREHIVVNSSNIHVRGASVGGADLSAGFIHTVDVNAIEAIAFIGDTSSNILSPVNFKFAVRPCDQSSDCGLPHRSRGKSTLRFGGPVDFSVAGVAQVRIGGSDIALACQIVQNLLHLATDAQSLVGGKTLHSESSLLSPSSSAATVVAASSQSISQATVINIAPFHIQLRVEDLDCQSDAVLPMDLTLRTQKVYLGLQVNDVNRMSLDDCKLEIDHPGVGLLATASLSVVAEVTPGACSTVRARTELFHGPRGVEAKLLAPVGVCATYDHRIQEVSVEADGPLAVRVSYRDMLIFSRLVPNLQAIAKSAQEAVVAAKLKLAKEVANARRSKMHAVQDCPWGFSCPDCAVRKPLPWISEPELEPEPEPEPELEQMSKGPLLIEVKQKLSFSIAFIDDAASRNLARPLICAQAAISALRISADEAHCRLMVEANHCSRERVTSPLLEPCEIAIQMDLCNRIADVRFDKLVQLVATESLIADYFHALNLFQDAWNSTTALETRAELEEVHLAATTICNNTGVPIHLTLHKSVVLADRKKLSVDKASTTLLLGGHNWPIPQNSFTAWRVDGTSIFAQVSAEDAGCVVCLSGAYTIVNDLSVALMARTSGARQGSSGEWQYQVMSQESCGLAISVSGSHCLELWIGNGSKVAFDTLASLQSQWIQLGEGWVCLNVHTRRVLSNALGPDPQTNFTWDTCTTLQVLPAITIVNNLLLPLELLLDSTESSCAAVDARGGRCELLCHTMSADQQIESVYMHAALIMHGCRFATTTAVPIHGAAELPDCLSLITDSGDCLFLSLHYTMLGLARVVDVCASHVLVNTCGLPLRIQHAECADADESGLRTGRTSEADPSTVSDWIQPQEAADVTILPVSPAEKKNKAATLFRLSAAGRKARSAQFNADTCHGMLELSCPSEHSRQIGVTNQREDLTSLEAAAWRKYHALNPAPMCRVVRLFPWLLFGNHLDCALQLVQWCDGDGESGPEDSRGMGAVDPHSTNSIHFPVAEPGQPKHVRLRVNGSNVYSKPFRADLLGEFAVWLPAAAEQGDGLLVRISVKSMDTTVFLHVQQEQEASPLFRLQNELTGKDVSIRQTGCTTSRTVPAGQSRAIGRDHPSNPCKFQLSIPGETDVECSPEEVGSRWQLGTILVAVVVMETTRTIVIKQKQRDGFVDEGVPTVQSKVKIFFLQGLALSLVTTQSGVCTETMVITLGHGRGCTLSSRFDSARLESEISIDSIQIDSMCAPSSSVVLQSIVVDQSKPALHIAAAVRLDTSATNSVHLDLLTISLQTLEIDIKTALLEHFVEVRQRIAVAKKLQLKAFKASREERRRRHRSKPNRSSGAEMFVHVRHFQLQPILLSLSVDTGFGIAVQKAPIRLQAVVLPNLCGSRDAVLSRIAGHLESRARTQVYRIVGSLGFLGNPVGLISTLGSGVYQFFFEPYQAVARSPRYLLDGLSKGTLALVDSTVEGAFHVPSEISGALSQAVAQVADTGSHAQRGTEIRSVLEGLQFAAEDLVHDAYFTATSIFVAPIKGALSGGVNGFAAGLGRGAAQTVAGAAALGLDLVHNLTTGLGQLFDRTDERRGMRVREKRVIHRGGVPEPFDEFRAQGQKLWELARARSLGGWGDSEDEYYNDHYPLPSRAVLLIGDIHIATVSVQEGQASPSLLWHARLDHLCGASAEGVTLHLAFDDSCGVGEREAALPATGDSNSHSVEMQSENDARLAKECVTDLVRSDRSRPWSVAIVQGHPAVSGAGHAGADASVAAGRATAIADCSQPHKAKVRDRRGCTMCCCRPTSEH